MKLINRTGEKHITKEGYEVEIIGFINSRNCTVSFIHNSYTIQNLKYLTVKNGHIKNHYHPSVYSIGYLGVGKYNSKNHNKCYGTWHNLLKRNYDKKNIEKYSAYKNCTVVEEWHNFQNFAQWYHNNWKSEYMHSGWHLDKDILVKGNKIYGPETCCFVPQEINKLFLKSKNQQGLPKGIKLRCGRYYTKLNNSHLGVFNTIEEAFEVYREAKELYIKEIADRWKDRITKKVYNALINYKINIDG